MATFDGWDAPLYGYSLPNGQDTLAHFRTKGSKNGVRRYQTESGEWTPLGLRERKAREGWGDGDRKSGRAARKAARAERRAANSAAKKERMAAYKEKRRSSNLKTMTDAEIKAKIARLKLEQEYKDLNRSPVLEVGKKLIAAYIDFKAKSEARKEAQEARYMEREKLKLERERIKADVTKAQENTKRAQADADKAKSDAEKMAADVKGGLKIERQTALKRAKIDWKGTTIHGGIARRINTMLNAGLNKKLEATRAAEGKVGAAKIEAEGKRSLDTWKNNNARADNKAEAKRYAEERRRQETEDRRRREKNRKDYERSLRRAGIKI